MKGLEKEMARMNSRFLCGKQGGRLIFKRKLSRNQWTGLFSFG